VRYPCVTQTVAGAVRLSLTGAFLAFGIWSALPALTQLEIPAPLALPSAGTTLQPTATTTVQPTTAATARPVTSEPASLTLTDADLTRSAQPYFPQSFAGVTVSSPSVRVTPGRILLDAKARSFFGSGPLVATATPYASDGRLLVRVESISLSGMALPDGVRAQVGQQLQAAIDAMAGSKMQVTSVTATTGMLTLRGAALR